MKPQHTKEAGHGSVQTYIIGFILSLALTVVPYLIVTYRSQTGRELLVTLSFFAILQLFVQLVFFLHLGRESKPRWNLTVFLFAGTIVLILVGGSLWIMQNLDYHMPVNRTDSSIIQDEGITP